MTHPLQPFRNSKHLHIPSLNVNERNFTWQRSCADSWDAMVNMASLYTDGAHDGQQRSLEDFHFDLESVLTMSQMVGKSAEERTAGSVVLDILAGTKNVSAAEVAVEIVTNAPKLSGQKMMYVVLATDTARRVSVREGNTKNGARAWSRLGRDSCATSFTEVFQYS